MHKPQIITRLTYTVCVCSLFSMLTALNWAVCVFSQLIPLPYANRENYHKAANDGRC